MNSYRLVGGPLHGKILEVEAPVLEAPHWTGGFCDYTGEPESTELGVQVTYRRITLTRSNEEGTRQIVETVMAPRGLHPHEIERLWKTLPPDEETVDHLQYNPRMQDWEPVGDEVERLRRRVDLLERQLEEANDNLDAAEEWVQGLKARLSRIRSNARRIDRIASDV